MGLREIPELPETSTKIYLQNNHIKDVPCTKLKYLKNLKELYLSQNGNIKLFNCSFSNVTSLERLSLVTCNLTSLPVGIFHSLRYLVALDVSENIVSNLDTQPFINMQRLLSLNLSQNKLRRIRNDTFQGLDALVFLSLQKNLLYYLSDTFELDAFQGLTSLKSLHLKGNRPNFSENLTYPEVSGHFQKLLLPGKTSVFFSQLPSLRTLLLYKNILGKSLSADSDGVTFSKLALLKNLDLSNNVIEDLPEMIFKNNANLKVLNLSNNELSYFRPSLMNQTKLEILDLSNNSLLGFSKQTCTQFLNIKKANSNFSVHIQGKFEPEALNEAPDPAPTPPVGSDPFVRGDRLWWRPLEPSIAGAVTSTNKTLVFFSENIFQDFHRQMEVNLAIMHELYLRRPVLIPVLLLKSETLSHTRPSWTDRSQPCNMDAVPKNNHHSRRKSLRVRQGTREIDDSTRFTNLLTHFPPEISVFLQGQSHRCLVYSGDSEHFWMTLKNVVMEE
ncbi:hypothetical protein RRG08_054189 [Elysia crispata]|uniref:Uncharacterized protein n=1 Tax=Elysia crispata TaxID=231223 RepID=A0AAE1A3R9_9GAST|nr:hypothetical protein RRG08_054189 [Elysia crispata]